MSGSGLYLPWSDLVHVLGEIDAMRLVAAFGGTRIYVAARMSERNQIVEAIGLDAARRLADHVKVGTGGMWVDLPSGPASAFKDLRRRVAEHASDRNLSASVAARRLGVHVRTIFRERARKRAEREDPQGGLFGES